MTTPGSWWAAGSSITTMPTTSRRSWGRRAAHGIPARLYVDNGCSYSNEQLSLICGSIGTVLLHTKVRDGASKAKIERQFRTLKNTSIHSGIGATPLERYQQTRSSIRSPKS